MGYLLMMIYGACVYRPIAWKSVTTKHFLLCCTEESHTVLE